MSTSTYASKKGADLAFRMSNYRRKKYIQKLRLKVPTIKKALYGKSIVAKLSSVTDANITNIFDWTTVYGLVSLMTSSADWANFRDSYALFNILHVTVKVFPQAFATTAGTNRMASLCYDTKDSNPLGSLASVADHNQHILMNFGANGADHYVFKASAKPTGYVPQKTSVTDENFGWIKAFADNIDFGAVSISIAKLEFNITVAFSQEQ